MDKTVYLIAEKAAALGGCAYMVGGCVRDMLLSDEDAVMPDDCDIDIEIHGLTPAQVEEALDAVGERMEFGKSFGVYGLKGHNIDIALPRTETAVGTGHRDFKICTDPFIGVKKAAQRRDFTINALMKNILTGEIIDEYGGLEDLKKGLIRHVDDKSFGEDPLRVLRAAQFSARLQFELAPETIEQCKKIDITTLSCERVMGEMKKALLMADKPSVFFHVLRKTDALHYWFYELEQLIDVPQNINYHQEGDVWNHTMMVLDEAARVRNNVKNPLGFMLSALTHDFGKGVATEVGEDGIAHAYMHEEKGLPLVRNFMNRLTNETRLTSYVLNMARLHMKPNVIAGAKSSVKASNRMFDDAEVPEDLIYLSQCDGLGKLPRDMDKVEKNKQFLTKRLALYREYMTYPYVTGKDLISAGLEPGIILGDALAYAHKLRLAGVDKKSALKQTIAYAEKKKQKGNIKL